MVFDNVKKLCNENKISIYRVEKDLGFSNGSICKWNTSNPSIDKIQKVANYFEVTVDSLLK